MKPKKYICPQCRAKTGVDILYGMPSPEAVSQVERGLDFADADLVLQSPYPFDVPSPRGKEMRIASFAYRFVDLDTLIEDFIAAVAARRNA